MTGTKRDKLFGRMHAVVRGPDGLVSDICGVTGFCCCLRDILLGRGHRT